LENETRERARERRNFSRADGARKNGFVPDYSSGTEKVPVGLGFRSAAGLWIFLVMIAGFAAVSCGQHRVKARVPTATTSQPSQDERQSANNAANDERQTPPVAPPTRTSNGTHLGPVTPGVDVGGNTIGPVETGMASWYGVPYHGRKASNGEIYDMYQFTAAHRTLPFETVVRVTNLSNGKQVDLRVIDRGPFVDNRIIDLSLAGARAIDLVGPGTARVKVEVMAAPANVSVTGGRFAVQVGAFADRANAERLRERLAADYHHISIQDTTGPTGRLFRVRVGSEPSEVSAQKLGNKLSGETGLHTFVVRLDDVTAAVAPRSETLK
jgi:rare lipoprotein A